MNLVQMLVESQSGAVVEQVASQFGLSSTQAKGVVQALAPVLARGVHGNASGGGLGALIGALGGGQHAQYLDRPQTLGATSTIADGNAILGHVLGSKDASRKVAARAAEQTGLSADLVKQMLPVVAAAVMGALSKQTQGGRHLDAAGDGSTLGMLEGLLDANRDGSVADDLLGMAKKFL